MKNMIPFKPGWIEQHAYCRYYECPRYSIPISINHYRRQCDWRNIVYKRNMFCKRLKTYDILVPQEKGVV